MSNLSNGSEFQIPNGYLKESIMPQLFYEDVDEESEIWLVRMPRDLNPAVVENERIILDGNQHNIECDENFRVEYVSDLLEQTKLNLVLPQKSDGKLRTVKKEFKGSIFFNEDIVLENSEVKMEMDNANDNELSVNSTSVLSGNFEESVSIQSNDNINLSEKPKKSKKKKSSLLKVKKEKCSDIDDFPDCRSQK